MERFYKENIEIIVKYMGLQACLNGIDKVHRVGYIC